MLEILDSFTFERDNVMNSLRKDVEQKPKNVYAELPLASSTFDCEQQSLPQRIETVSRFFKINDYVSQSTGKRAGIYIHNSRGEIIEDIEFRHCHDMALEQAQKLTAAGIKKDDRVALLATTTKSFILNFMACQFVGALPIMVPTTINLGGRKFFIEKLSNMFRVAQPNYILFNESFRDFFESVKDITPLIKDDDMMSYEFIDSLEPQKTVLSPFTVEQGSNIQFSSGSTGVPKGIFISQKALMHNLYYAAKRYDVNLTNSVLIGWLPFYHDMGFIGLLLSAICNGVSFFCFEPSVFAKNPLLWLKLIARYRGTLTAAPNFSYGLILRKLRAKQIAAPEKVADMIGDLSSMRTFAVGSEMVNHQIMKDFINALEPFGLNPKAISPAYGMAEATLSIAMYKPLESYMKVDKIKRQDLQEKQIAVPLQTDSQESYCHFVACGKSIEKHYLRITDNDGNVLPERHVGNIEFFGVSLMNGYYKDDIATKDSFTPDGYLRTGDLGYIADGEIYVTGRKKQMIICNGKNIFPSDLEFAIMEIDIFRINDIAAFSIWNEHKGEILHIVAQTRIKKDDMPDLIKKIQGIVYAQSGAMCQVTLISTGQMPLTSSGKLNREMAKELYINKQFNVLQHSE